MVAEQLPAETELETGLGLITGNDEGVDICQRAGEGCEQRRLADSSHTLDDDDPRTATGAHGP